MKDVGAIWLTCGLSPVLEQSYRHARALFGERLLVVENGVSMDFSVRMEDQTIIRIADPDPSYSRAMNRAADWWSTHNPTPEFLVFLQDDFIFIDNIGR